MSSLPSIISLDHVVDAVAAYNHGILNLFDRHAPIVTQTVSIDPEIPWCNPFNELKGFDSHVLGPIEVKPKEE